MCATHTVCDDHHSLYACQLAHKLSRSTHSRLPCSSTLQVPQTTVTAEHMKIHGLVYHNKHCSNTSHCSCCNKGLLHRGVGASRALLLTLNMQPTHPTAEPQGIHLPHKQPHKGHTCMYMPHCTQQHVVVHYSTSSQLVRHQPAAHLLPSFC